MSTYTVPPPGDPIQAVTHPDPYPYCRRLVREGPLYFDDSLHLWVAASAAAVRAVLTSELCHVRPPAEPVPGHLVDSAAADIFRHLVRMNDGQKHGPVKQAISAALGGVDGSRFSQRCERWAGRLFDEIRPDRDRARLKAFSLRLPMYVLGDLLGVHEDELELMTERVDAYVASLRPTSSPAQIEQGHAASAALLDLGSRLLAEHIPGLAGQLWREAERGEVADRLRVVAANTIGLLAQTYEATAGLIGNTLVNMARHAEIMPTLLDDRPHLLAGIIAETLRYDAPVQNTRRFVIGDGVVAGQPVKAGDTVLVILAAANHDAAANPQPEYFDPFRQERQIYTFGVGAHACPGERLASSITLAAIQQCLKAGMDVRSLAEHVSYLESPNVRIPLFMEDRR